MSKSFDSRKAMQTKGSAIFFDLLAAGKNVFHLIPSKTTYVKNQLAAGEKIPPNST